MNRKNQNKIRKTLLALLATSATFAVSACGGDVPIIPAAKQKDQPTDPTRSIPQTPALQYVTASCGEGSGVLEIFGEHLNGGGVTLVYRAADSSEIIKSIAIESDGSVIYVDAQQANLSLADLNLRTGDYDLSVEDAEGEQAGEIRVFVPAPGEPCNTEVPPTVYSVSFECVGTASADTVIHGSNLAFFDGEEMFTEIYIGDESHERYSQTLSVDNFTASWEVSEYELRIPIPVDARTRTYQIMHSRQSSNVFTVNQSSIAALDCAGNTVSNSMVIDNIAMVCADAPGQYRLEISGSGFGTSAAELEDLVFAFELIDPYGAEWDTAFTDFGPMVVIANDNQLVVQTPYADYDVEKTLRMRLNREGEDSNPFTFLVPVGSETCGN